MRRIVLGIEYDGSPWHGWQTQPDGQTVQDQVQTALRRFARVDLVARSAGRTDTGVHAIEQIVHVDTVIQRREEAWVRGLNSFLPPSIVVRWATEVPYQADGFHARFSARLRTYDYLLYNHPVRSPLLHGRAGWTFRPLSVEPMQTAAEQLLGTHDFSAFRSTQCQAKSPVRTLHAIQITRHQDLLALRFQADGFLHHMVRNLVGSLVYVGIGKRSAEWLQEVLQGADRTKAAPTFMPDGLYLTKVGYDASWQLPQQALPRFPWLGPSSH